ncbi:MAG TPA: FtsQ-type POTRA domain-containing protein [Candidatus Acidoferrales bacterium]|nr:FtsQ-type POTRA domain-containing protein [Candidatus Acidoferrales bacterium]
MDADAYPQEVLADEEPKYLRRQKPLEIKRRKFGRKAWKTYLRVTVGVGVGVAGVCVAYAFGNFLFASPQMALIHSNQVELTGNHYVPRGSVLAVFKSDQGHSVLRIPLTERRRQLEAIPWVEQAVVRRALPNRIEVEITERVPIAFLRQGSDLALVDIHGVILDRPLKANFHFPVVTGIREDMTPDEREKRMQLFAGFTQQVDSARAGSMEKVSEVDLTDARDLRASIAGLNGDSAPSGSAPNQAWDTAAGSLPVVQTDSLVLVHFGDKDFETKYRTLLDDFGQWHAKTGRVESVDLRFDGEAVVNPDTTLAQQIAQQPVTQVQPAPRAVHAAHKRSSRRSR